MALTFLNGKYYQDGTEIPATQLFGKAPVAPTYGSHPAGTAWGDYITTFNDYIRGFSPTWGNTPTGMSWGDYGDYLNSYKSRLAADTGIPTPPPVSTIPPPNTEGGPPPYTPPNTYPSNPAYPKSTLDMAWGDKLSIPNTSQPNTAIPSYSGTPTMEHPTSIPGVTGGASVPTAVSSLSLAKPAAVSSSADQMAVVPPSEMGSLTSWLINPVGLPTELKPYYNAYKTGKSYNGYSPITVLNNYYNTGKLPDFIANPPVSAPVAGTAPGLTKGYVGVTNPFDEYGNLKPVTTSTPETSKNLATWLIPDASGYPAGLPSALVPYYNAYKSNQLSMPSGENALVVLRNFYNTGQLPATNTADVPKIGPVQGVDPNYVQAQTGAGIAGLSTESTTEAGVSPSTTPIPATATEAIPNPVTGLPGTATAETAATDPYADLMTQLLTAIQGLGKSATGSAEAFLPATATSELSQALQSKALEGLNRPYGYTSEEQAALYKNAIDQFNASEETDLDRLMNLYQQFGWDTGAPELGGQARGSLNEYFKQRGLGESNLTAQLLQQIIAQRNTEEQNAMANAQGVNAQLYEQTRGDFADTLSYMKYMSDEEQRNFLNQQGITDRETQNYYQDQANALKQEDIYAQLLSGMDASEAKTIEDAMNAYLGQGDISSAMLLLTAAMGIQGGGTTDTAGTDSGTTVGTTVGTAAGKAVGDFLVKAAGVVGSVLTSAPFLAFAPVVAGAIYAAMKQDNLTSGGFARKSLEGTSLENDEMARYIPFKMFEDGIIYKSTTGVADMVTATIGIAKAYESKLIDAYKTKGAQGELEIAAQALSEFTKSKAFSRYVLDVQEMLGKSDPSKTNSGIQKKIASVPDDIIKSFMGILDRVSSGYDYGRDVRW